VCKGYSCECFLLSSELRQYPKGVSIFPQSWPGAPYWPWHHYPVALLQADGNYDLEKSNKPGDAGDLYSTTGAAATLSAQTVPDSNTYQSMYFHSLFSYRAQVLSWWEWYATGRIATDD
jgi:hypothetical protein